MRAPKRIAKVGKQQQQQQQQHPQNLHESLMASSSHLLFFQIPTFVESPTSSKQVL
jgi:hypothetical protein